MDIDKHKSFGITWNEFWVERIGFVENEETIITYFSSIEISISESNSCNIYKSKGHWFSICLLENEITWLYNSKYLMVLNMD